MDLGREIATRVLLEALRATRTGSKLEIGILAERCRVHPDQVSKVMERYVSGDYRGRIAIAIGALQAGCEAALVARELTWDEMEHFILDVAKRTGYNTLRDIRFKTGGRRHQVDLILWRNSVCLVVDCKRWSRPPAGRVLNSLVTEQEMRCQALAQYIHGISPGPRDVYFHPVIVTVYEPRFRQVGETHVVPINTLVVYLNTMDRSYVSRGYRAQLAEDWYTALKKPGVTL
jgi:hypothetical protein